MSRPSGTRCSMIASLRMNLHARVRCLSQMHLLFCVFRWLFVVNVVARGIVGASAVLSHLLAASRLALDVAEGDTMCARSRVLLVLKYDTINNAVLP